MDFRHREHGVGERGDVRVSRVHERDDDAVPRLHFPEVRGDLLVERVIRLAPDDAHSEQIPSNLTEVKARDGIVIALVNPGDADVATFADAVLTMPKIHPALQPIVSVVPLQLLAYHVARRRGCDIDQPRNLAKSVTVE